MKPIQPTFIHDCKHCTFLGHISIASGVWAGEYDLYHHPGTAETVIARYGDDGPEYTSGLYGTDQVIPLNIAKEMAELRKIA